MNAEGEIRHEGSGGRTSETVAGFLAAIAIFVSLIGLAWHPLRLILPALVDRAGRRGDGRPARGASQFAAVLIGAVCFFFGMTIAVVTQRRSGSDAALLQRTWTWDGPTSTG